MDPEHRSDPHAIDVSAATGESRALRWALTGAAHRVGDAASAVYGTILVASLLIAIDGGPITVIGGVVATALVFWLAHVHVGLLRRVVRNGEHVHWADARAALIEEWPLVQSSMTPLVPMIVAAFGLLSEPTARSLGLAICIIQLIAWGIAISRSAALGRRGTALTIGINVLLGIVLIILKLLVH